jgi:uncharacterized membrane protein
MTRDGFISALREGLQGAAPTLVGEVVADYEAHFAEGVAAGRSEADVAAALGDPRRLARELRAEAGLKRWESERNPANAAGAIVALIGLGAIDILFLLPVLFAIIGTMIGLFVADIAVFVGGSALVAFGAFIDGPSNPVAAPLFGLGMMAGSVSAGAVLVLISIALTNALVWYGRLHYRLLKPAMTGGQA